MQDRGYYVGNSRYTSNLQVRTNGWKFIVFGSAMFGVGAVLGGVIGVLLFVCFFSCASLEELLYRVRRLALLRFL